MTDVSPAGERRAGRPARKLFVLIAGPAVSVILMLLPAPEGMPPEAWRLVSLATWMAIWWLTEALPLAATALLPIVVMPVYEIAPIRAVTEDYGHPLIFLFLGGFMLAMAIQSAGLHRRLALHIVNLIGGSPRRIILGFMLATAFLSMWISNPGAAMLMFTVGISVIGFVGQRCDDKAAVRGFGVALMLGIAYASSIGGVSTLIGTAPNALLASTLEGEYGLQISFFQWMQLGLPLTIVMLPLCWLLLTGVLYPPRDIQIGDASNAIRDQIAALGPMSLHEKIVGATFALTAFGWVFRQPIASLTGLPISDTSIVIAAAIVLFAMPISLSRGRFALDWDTAKALPWSVLILFGGGLALAQGFQETGLAAWIGASVAGFQVSTFVLIVVITTVIVFATELTSNTATTATFLPVLAAVAVGLELDPRLLALPVAFAASMAFMMPVATPSNAIVFSYDGLRIGDMARAGLWLNVLAIVVVSGMVYFVIRPTLGL
ncbi:MAG: DASS family sodium-coupled anion symporter [Pseudomonadota bacterium]